MHHSAGLGRLTRDPELAGQLAQDYAAVVLGSRKLAMLDYAAKLTLTPGEMTEDDVAALRAADFSDRDILDINQVTAYYAYVNRLADGLGVQVESS